MAVIKNNRIKQQIDRFKKSFLQSKELSVEDFFLPTVLPTLSPKHRTTKGIQSSHHSRWFASPQPSSRGMAMEGL
jgi:hypothetical protein